MYMLRSDSKWLFIRGKRSPLKLLGEDFGAAQNLLDIISSYTENYHCHICHEFQRYSN